MLQQFIISYGTIRSHPPTFIGIWTQKTMKLGNKPPTVSTWASADESYFKHGPVAWWIMCNSPPPHPASPVWLDQEQIHVGHMNKWDLNHIWLAMTMLHRGITILLDFSFNSLKTLKSIEMIIKDVGFLPKWKVLVFYPVHSGSAPWCLWPLANKLNRRRRRLWCVGTWLHNIRADVVPHVNSPVSL